MRYVVTEIEGYNQVRCSSNSRFGLSCMVVDTLWNHRTVATFRTEDVRQDSGAPKSGWNVPPMAKWTQDERFGIVRERAATRCDLLNRLAREAQGAVA